MGHLDRYKKSGGFMQLLELIESFAPAKQEKFLALIQDENPIWAKALKDKLITVPRISKWPSATLAEIFPHMNINLLAIALHGLQPPVVEHFLAGLPAGEKRKIQTEFELVKPQPNEVATTHQKMIEAVRKLVSGGSLRVEAFDPDVVLSEEGEDQLLRFSNFVKGETQQAEESEGELQTMERPAVELVKEAVRVSAGGGSLNSAAETKAQQTLIVSLQKEIKVLRGEVKMLRDKLDAIRKIA